MSALRADPSLLSSEEGEDSLYEALEYADMLFLESPRVTETDQVDPFLSRYTVPDPLEKACAVRVLSWSGILSSSWILNLICSIM
jgi:ribonucleases P/MRP protein subunit RPP40